jgi:SAM-dependent methyltransferase
MTDRTEGYVTDVGYTHDYCHELNPLRARLALLNAGMSAPEVATACELGFGQGLSLNIHAAASPADWYGTDINTSHAGFARNLASASGATVEILDEAFGDFANRPDLPDFDYIGLRGVWSWISDRNRVVIVDFIRRKLRTGGIVYLDYNALPGWAAFSPMRHLLVEHANRGGASDRGTAARVDDAMAFAARLLSTHPEYAKDNPQILDRIKTLSGEDRRYVAHEYFNRDWVPMHFSTVAEWLKPARVDYAGSANFSDHLDALNLSNAQRELLEEIHDPVLRQSTRDFIINRTFRHDYWIRGAQMLSAPARAEALRKVRVMLVTRSPELPFQLHAALALHRNSFGAATYAAVLEILVDYKVRSIGELEQTIGHKGISLGQIVDAVTFMAGLEHIAAAQDETVIARVRPHTDRLNAHLIERARTSGDIADLASPVTGGGVRVRRTHQLFLSALRQGRARPEEWADDASKFLVSKQTDPSLIDDARAFAAEKLPLLRALQVV